MRLRPVALAVFLALAVAAASFAQRPDPGINQEFPVRDPGNLSPPIVFDPIHVCARRVYVSGFIKHAIVRVYAGTTDLVGNAQPWFGFAEIDLTRELNLGESITATQEVSGIVSGHSVDPVIVTPYPPLPAPVVSPEIYGCGRVVPVDHLEPSAQVVVRQNGGQVGAQLAARPWEPIVTLALTAGATVKAQQIACRDRAGSTITGPESAGVTVLAPPSPMTVPVLEAWYPGNDAVTMNNLLTGAAVTATSGGTTIGGGLATGSRNWMPVVPSLTATSDPRIVQKLCDRSDPSNPVPPSTRLPAPEIVRPVCIKDKYVRITGTVLNANVVLLRGGTVIGYGSADPGELKLALGSGVTLAEGQIISVRQYIGSILSGPSSAVVECAPQNVLTQHNDNGRTGQYLAETRLAPSNVNAASFGLRYARTVDGEILAQPLYLRKVPTAAGTKNLFFIATSTNHVYAFDADNMTASDATPPIWHVGPIETTGPAAICGETQPARVGITSTPVIDAGTRTMYVVARSVDGQHHLHALDVTNGSDRRTPVTIAGSDRGTDFHAQCHRNRPGLLLQNGVVYVAFGTFSCDASCSDTDPYHGWVMAHRASDLGHLAAFCTTHDGGGAGVWQSGNGLVGAGDGTPFGSVYFETGNELSRSQRLGDSFVRIRLRARSSGYELVEVNKFTPSNAVRLMNGDTDLGSGGPMLLPGTRLIGGGKEGKYYLLDSNLAAVSEFQAFLNTWHLPPIVPPGAPDCDRSDIWADLPAGCHMDPSFYQDSEHWGPNIHAGPVYFEPDPAFGFVYQLPEKDVVKAFRYDTATHTIASSPAFVGALRQPVDGMPGGFSSVSAKQRTNGIIWVSIPLLNGQWNNVAARLAALDALDLHELWRDTDNVTFSKFCAPTIADGKVIRATWFGRVLVYASLARGEGGGRRPWRPNPRWSIEKTKMHLGSEPEPFCYTLAQKYAVLGGERSYLGKPLRKNEGKSRVHSAEFMARVIPDGVIASVTPLPHHEHPACDKPERAKYVDVPAAIYESESSCAHVVQGEILEFWRKAGAEKSRYGLPIADETITPDGHGRISVFENAALVWYPYEGVREIKEPYR